MKLDLSLPELINETDAIARDAQSAFGQLNAEQLNWKASAESWSVAQCLDHMIVTNNLLLPIFEQVVNGTRQTRFLERLPFWAGLWGRMMVKMLAPGSTQKFKAPPTAVPSSSKLDPRIVSQFATHQQEVSRKVKAVEKLNPDKIVITSPFAGFMTYSLLDAARIIVIHERRHFEQARRVMAAEGFPN